MLRRAGGIIFWLLSLGVLSITSSHIVNGQDGTLCLSGVDYLDEDKSPVREYYICPQPGDPPDHIQCCDGACCSDVVVDSVLKA